MGFIKRKRRKEDWAPRPVTVLVGPTGVLTRTEGICPLGRKECARYRQGRLMSCVELADTNEGRQGQEAGVSCEWKPPKEQAEKPNEHGLYDYFK